jgi:cytochrome c oxidase assembly protein Cox11
MQNYLLVYHVVATIIYKFLSEQIRIEFKSKTRHHLQFELKSNQDENKVQGQMLLETLGSLRLSSTPLTGPMLHLNSE